MSEGDGRPTIEILTPGILTTVQDQGRLGYQSLGIAESGAMDTFSFVAANRLVGNPDDSACLEITLLGPKIRFLVSTWGSLTGANLSARLNHRILNPGTTFKAEVGDLLTFGPRVYGLRAYLAVEGGIDVPVVLGSRSTYIYAGFGGYEGRSLQKGDILSVLKPRALDGPVVEGLPSDFQIQQSPPFFIRVIIGPHEDRFTSDGFQSFLNSPYVVTSESNRMGYRLKGPRITHRESPIVVSEATPLGAVQVPGQGNPVILLRERGTTGGYAKIGCVITADLDALAQIFPGEEIYFRSVDLGAAHRVDKDRWEGLGKWRRARQKYSGKLAKIIRCQGFIETDDDPKYNSSWKKEDFMKQIDLNCDLGEGFGAWKMGFDEDLMKYITSANIACGWHGGDPLVMNKTVQLAKENKVSVGAHPGYPDLLGFGRRSLDCTFDELKNYLIYQVGALDGFCKIHGVKMTHVKPHGKMYLDAFEKVDQARAIAEAIVDYNPNLFYVAFAGTKGKLVTDVAKEMKLKVVYEAFPDRAYTPQGDLVSRSIPGAVIKNPHEAAERALRMAKEDRIIAIDGTSLHINVQTLCVHGDTPTAVDLVRIIRETLTKNGIEVVPLVSFM